jgi:CheY-like chemotaxis protein
MVDSSVIAAAGVAGKSADSPEWMRPNSARTAAGVVVGQMIKILLVEDSKFLRLATERALTRAGYRVNSARDGDEALRMAREMSPDLILLDMMLPKKSGPEVLRELKADSTMKAIPVVVLSGLTQKNAARLGEDGASGYLEKGSLALDKGSEHLLKAVREIVEKIRGTGVEATLA